MDRRDLGVLMGPSAVGLLRDATIVAWQPSADYKPEAYYWTKPLNEAQFRAHASDVGLSPEATTTRLPGALKLPDDVRVRDWQLDAQADVPGLQAEGDVGSTRVWLRWSAGRLYGAAMPRRD